MVKLDKKSRFALLSVGSNTILIIFKIVAGILSGSVSIISEAIHSAMDLVASIVAFFSVRSSSKPADKEHPYGHGKIENLSGVAEGLLIFVASGMIIFEAIKKISKPVEIEQAYVAIGVMVVAAIVNFFVSRQLHKVAKEEDSMALEADSLHLKTDVYTSLGVGVGILLIKVTGFHILDSIVAILVALLIIREAWELCYRGVEYLIDVRLTDEEEQEIESIIQKVIADQGNQVMDYHKLKTRKSGNKRHIDFHIVLDSRLTVGESHDIVGCFKKEIGEKFNNTRVNVHIDPYKEEEQ
ncbi:cation diffusion facilitator family transporter [Parasporobacterium paucivorans]|uniref:Cation diffusion facilitator family transporter n=1 Tax=Parasporobacterium paucivorans DSM 15970 TaxID=1122934 RepID=A0A1M6D124_9FIRM|nr:cation diffusion facilitator family transporter [Parasporobacterium paucivorans]SHI66764.1 cation diffusion facilitator family transporter [Parasporobacterium paucivorans DSM 15970]